MRVDAEVTEGRSLAWPLTASGVAGVLLFYLARQDSITATTFVTLAALFTALAFITLAHAAPARRGRGRRRVGADARGLTVDGELVLPRQSIARAHVQDEPSGACSVIVQRRGLAGPLTLHVSSARIAQALADTLERSPLEVSEVNALPPWAHRLRWLSIALTTSPWVLWMFSNVFRYVPAWSLLIMLGLYGVLGLPMVLPQKVAIGEDGILLRWAGRRRFIPFGQLHAAHPTALGVRLELEDGRDVEVRLSHRTEAAAAPRTAMLAKIEHGLAVHRALLPAEDEALLARGERELELWIEEMTALGRSELHGYRTSAIPRERLWAVLENPTADASARQGAALALLAHLDDEERERLASIGQKTASPRLRIALDAVLHTADPPRLRVALEQAEDLAEGSLCPEAQRRVARDR